MINEDDCVNTAEEIEKSLRKKFHRSLFARFTKAIRDYALLSAGDKIAVCVSGGKDSMLCAKLFQELKRHGRYPFELVFLVMDPGYSADNRRVIELNAETLGVPITVFESDIFDTVYSIERNPCYLCARMRRGHLYAKARELGCNKIALGHHYDDVIETILMGLLYGGQFQTMMPKLKSQNFPGMELIRPLYLIREADIIAWRNHNHLCFIQCACRFTDDCTACTTARPPESTTPSGSAERGAAADRDEAIVRGGAAELGGAADACGVGVAIETAGSKRTEMKRLIAELKKTNPNVDKNIFAAAAKVNLSTVIGYKSAGEYHSFLDEY